MYFSAFIHLSKPINIQKPSQATLLQKHIGVKTSIFQGILESAISLAMLPSHLRGNQRHTRRLS